MVERVTRDLERERATSRNLRRELDELRSESAEQRRALVVDRQRHDSAMDDRPVPPRRAHARGHAAAASKPPAPGAAAARAEVPPSP